MKDVIRRWNELAGTNKTVNETREPRIAAQDVFGNQFLKGLLNEQGGDFQPDLDENVDEDLGDALADKAEEEGGNISKDEEEEDAELGDDEKPTLSNSDLMKGLKQGAKAIADSIPPALNDEFADVMNSVKDMASDKQKMIKLIKYIEKIR